MKRSDISGNEETWDAVPWEVGYRVKGDECQRKMPGRVGFCQRLSRATAASRFLPRPGAPGPQDLDEPHQAHPEDDAAREEQQKVHRPDVGSSPLGSDQADNHRDDKDRRTTSRRRFHCFPFKASDVVRAVAPVRECRPQAPGSGPD